MISHVVIGLGFGDEGKGLVTDFLCSKDPDVTQVVRFSGGHQCAHRVVRGDVDHVFSNFGSGTILGCPTHWSNYCTFEPVGFTRERNILVAKGEKPVISVDPDCPVTTPYDIMANHAGPELEHGTTGVGFFRTKKRHYQDGLELTVNDLVCGPSAFIIGGKLRTIRSYYGISEDPGAEGAFYSACRSLGKYIRRGKHPRRERLIFEGSQGLLLDEKIGTMPHCTPSDVTPRNALKMTGHIDEVWLVSRVYQTRHGTGPMTNEDLPVRFKDGVTESNDTNEFQGEFRTSVLDVDQLLNAKVRGIDEVVPDGTRVNLIMTCADQVERYEFTEHGEAFSFRNAEPFVRAVGGSLGVNGDLYVSTGPFSSAIKSVKE